MLYPGNDGAVYYLEEKTPKAGYQLPDEDVIFSLSALGEPKLISGGSNLQFIEAEDQYILTIDMLNVKDAVPLEIRKTVSGNMGNKQKEFTFTFTTADGDTYHYEWKKNDVLQSTKLQNGDTFKLSHDDKVVIMVPAGTDVTISEEAGKYETWVKLNDGEAEKKKAVTISDISDETTVSFENKLNTLIPTGIFTNHLPLILLLIGLVCGIFLTGSRLSRRRRESK